VDDTEPNLNEQQLVRRQKLTELRDLGIEPYPLHLPRERTHTAAGAIAAFTRGELAEGQLVTLVGRMMTVRVMGKAAFAHIEDGSGRVQIYLKRDVLGEATYDALFRKLVDLGDFITVTGIMFTTRSGEVSCEVHELGLLSKTLNPLPDKWHGVKDVETRFRQRYVDLLANPEVRDVFITRAKIVRAIRRYLDDNGFLEVETPVLQPIYGGAAARPFVTHHNQLDQDLFLRISFELYLKRLLVGGYERVYEIGRDFRNEGISFKHNPEFTQLEWYEAYTDYHGVMARVEALLAAIALEVKGHLKLTYAEHEIDLTPPWRRITMRDAIREATGLDYTLCPDAASLAEAMRGIGHRPESTSRGKLIDSLFATHVEPNLIQPTFITLYPTDVSPLSRRNPEDPEIVDRFELFIAGREIANGFSELNDPIDQRERFLEQLRERGDEGDTSPRLDEDFLRALEFGMPPTAGEGIGIDRLVMLLADAPSIRDVIFFPLLRAEK
jgi:lysyl-tRNA synthetase class 2